MDRLLHNRIRCKHCNDTIESHHVHDYRHCSCGKVSVDGGRYYERRGFPTFPPEDHYEELSEYEETDAPTP